MTKIPNLSPKQKIYLASAVWLVILVLVIVFIIIPLVSQIKKDGLELTQKKQQMESFYENWQILTKSQKDYQAMQDELYALPAILPSGEALKFIVLIEKFAQATNNQQNVSVVGANEQAKAQKTSPAKEITDFQINLRGNFPDLIKFMVYLENAPYYNNIKTLGIQRLSSKDDKNASAGQINTTLTVSVSQ